MHKTHRALGLLALLAVAGAAQAQYLEGATDAGQSLGTAREFTSPIGNINTIDGAISDDSDVDLYRVFIPNLANFSATLDTTNPAFTITDTQIFLFNSLGQGIAYNDDITRTAPSNFLSHLPQGNSLYASLPGGFYFIGISEFDNDPFDANDDYIFPFNSTAATSPLISAPNAGMETAVLDGWDAGFGDVGGTYRLTLTGVTTAPVPEPATMLAIGAGIAGLVARRRRK